MTEEFPLLQKRQVALLRADVNTGIVLDESYNYATNSFQKVYTVFPDKFVALEAAKKLITERSTVECCIYDDQEKLLWFLNSDNIRNF